MLHLWFKVYPELFGALHNRTLDKNEIMCMEAFSDGVLAIIITIMVLELAVPIDNLSALRPLIPIFLSYVLSFVHLGIYWNNHHHLLQATRHVDGHVLWANLHLLFWLSLIPFVTGWMGENEFAAWPVALYGTILLFSAIAYFDLSQTLSPSMIVNSPGNRGWARFQRQDFGGDLHSSHPTGPSSVRGSQADCMSR